MINEVELSVEDILSKEFKVDMKGYRLQEVDKFLDVVIHDYEIFNKTIKQLSIEKNELVDENIALKQEIRSLKAKIEVLANTSNDSSTTADVLRRLSNLEKIVYENEKK